MCRLCHEFGLLRFVLFALAVVGMLCMADAPSRADSIETVGLTSLVPGIYNNSFEELTAGFLWDSTTSQVIPNSTSVTGSGALGSFSFLDEFANNGIYFFQFQDTFGDVFTYNTFPGDFPNPGSYGTQLSVNCATQTDACSSDGFGGFYPLKGELTVSQVPDSSSFLELLLSEVSFFGVLGAIAAGRRWHYRRT